MSRFLTLLLDDGEVLVERDESVVADPESVAFLASAEATWRRNWTDPPPEFHVRIAVQAAEILCVFSRAIVHRELEMADIRASVVAASARISTIAESLKAAELHHAATHHSDAIEASVFYSVDLTMRFLPQLAERAARVTEADPLLELMNEVARHWPLSSVGMTGTAPEQLPRALLQPGLWQAYLDRIICFRDTSRMICEAVRQSVAVAVSPFPELVRAFAKADLSRTEINPVNVSNGSP